MPKYTNEQVIQAFIQQPPDERMIGAVYDEVQKMVKPYILKNSGNIDEVGDVVNDTFMVFANAVVQPGFTFTSAYTTYIYGIARYKWLNRLAQNKKEIGKHTPIDPNEPNFDDDEENQLPAFNPADTSALADEDIALAEVRQLFWLRLHELGELCKQILLLRYADALSHKEIKETLALNTESASKENLSRCSKKLKEQITRNPAYQKFIVDHFPFVKSFITTNL